MSKCIMALVVAVAAVTSIHVAAANAQDSPWDDVYQEAIWDIQAGFQENPNTVRYAANATDDSADDVYQEAIWDIQAGSSEKFYATQSASLPTAHAGLTGKYIANQKTPLTFYDGQDNVE